MKYLLISAIFYLLFSCNLYEEPTDTAKREPVFSSQYALQVYSNSFYDILPSGEDIPQMDTWMSDFVARTGVESFLQPGAFGPRQSSGWSWSQLRNINFFIENCTSPSVPLAVREHYIGLARLFRAIFYFEKVKRFGDVPWVETVLDENDPAVFGKRDSREFVMDKVLEDLNYACQKITTTTDRSRSLITLAVANGYKSRICLFEGSYRKYHTELGLSSSANDWFKHSYNAAQYVMKQNFSIYNDLGVEKSYRELFISQRPVESEIMLAYLCDPALKVTTGANRRFISPTYDRRASLSRFFIHTYLNTDGTPYTATSGYDKKEFKDEVLGRDKRLGQTIRQGMYMRTSNGVPEVAPPDFGITLTGYQPIKFCYDEKLPYDNESLNDNAITRMRYAEILLNFAEAKAELGELTDAEWELTVGELRKRAGITGGLNTKPTVVDTYLQSTFFPTISDPVLLEIRRERAVELVFEGFRFADLLRWKAGNLTDKSFNGIYVPAANTPMDLNGDGKNDVRFYTGAKPAALNGVVDVQLTDGKNYYLSNGTYGELIWNPGVREWKEYKYLYPIPQDQVNLNPNLLIDNSNNGWPQ